MHREKSVALSDAKRTLPLHNHAYRLADYQGVFDASVDAMHNAVSRESSLLMQVVQLEAFLKNSVRRAARLRSTFLVGRPPLASDRKEFTKEAHKITTVLAQSIGMRSFCCWFRSTAWCRCGELQHRSARSRYSEKRVRVDTCSIPFGAYR